MIAACYFSIPHLGKFHFRSQLPLEEADNGLTNLFINLFLFTESLEVYATNLSYKLSSPFRLSFSFWK